MTRKELLAARANDVVEACLAQGVCLSEGECTIVRDAVFTAQMEVEREVIDQHAWEIVRFNQLEKDNKYLSDTVDRWEKICQEQAVKIEQQAKEIITLTDCYKSTVLKAELQLTPEIEKLQPENKTLREALQACQSRLGCGCGDILCTTCSAVYDVADQALKEVS